MRSAILLRQHCSVKRTLSVFLVTFFMLSATSALAAAPRSGPEAAAEQQFFSLTNSSRGQEGLSPMGPSGGWQEQARNQADEMAASNSIFHNANLGAEAGSLGCWTRIGENVGRGPSVEAIHNAFMNSPTHRNNLMGDYDALGVGVKISADGTVYVTQRFLKSCGGPAPAPAAPAPAAPPAQAPAAPAPAAHAHAPAKPAPPAPPAPAPAPMPAPVAAEQVAPPVAPPPPAPASIKEAEAAPMKISSAAAPAAQPQDQVNLVSDDGIGLSEIWLYVLLSIVALSVLFVITAKKAWGQR